MWRGYEIQFSLSRLNHQNDPHVHDDDHFSLCIYDFNLETTNSCSRSLIGSFLAVPSPGKLWNIMCSDMLNSIRKFWRYVATERSKFHDTKREVIIVVYCLAVKFHRSLKNRSRCKPDFIVFVASFVVIL